MRPNGAAIGIFGLWLIVAGIIGFSVGGNVWNDVIVGIIVAILGFAMAGPAPAQGLLSGILGIWMIISAFAPSLNVGVGARWNDIIVGLILAIAGFSPPRRLAQSTSDIRRAA